MKILAKYNCLQSLKKEGPPIIIAAAVREVEAIIKACLDAGIVVSALCDSEKRKSEKIICGLEVIHTPNLSERFPKARIIIAYHDIQKCLDPLSELGYDDFYSPLELLENYDLGKHQYQISQSFMKEKIEVNKKSHQYYFDGDKTYMRSLDVMVTTKCSLKCANCSNLMQYYTDAKNTDHDDILKALDILYENVDYISEFRVIGGEPLMNKGWADVVNGISDKNPEAKIFVYTNATIAPKDDHLKSFEGKKVNFTITDYGKLSKNVDKMIEKLDHYNISYNRSPPENWVDCSRIHHHKRSVSKLEEVFKQCCSTQLYTLLNGRLYTCPFIANAYTLKAVPNNSADYIELLSETKTDNFNKKIRNFIKGRKFFPACDFCDGRPYDPSSSVGYDGRGMIEGGLQVAKPVPYKIYN